MCFYYSIIIMSLWIFQDHRSDSFQFHLVFISSHPRCLQTSPCPVWLRVCWQTLLSSYLVYIFINKISRQMVFLSFLMCPNLSPQVWVWCVLPERVSWQAVASSLNHTLRPMIWIRHTSRWDSKGTYRWPLSKRGGQLFSYQEALMPSSRSLRPIALYISQMQNCWTSGLARPSQAFQQ